MILQEEIVLTLIPMLSIIILFILMVFMVILYVKLRIFLVILVLFLFSLIMGVSALMNQEILFTPYLQIFFLLFQTSFFLITALGVFTFEKEI